MSDGLEFRLGIETQGAQANTAKLEAHLASIAKSLGAMDAKFEAAGQTMVQIGLGVADGMKAWAEDTKRAGVETEAAGKKAKKAETEVQALTKRLKELKEPGKIEDLKAQIEALEPHGITAAAVGTAIGMAIHSAFEHAVHLGKEMLHIGVEMVHVAAAAERTENSFGMLFGAEGAEEMLHFAEGIAKNTEFTGDALKGVVQSLGKAGFEGDALVRANAAALDMAAFSSDPKAGHAAAIMALSSIKRTGTVENEMLRGLGIGKNDFLGELAKRTGQSTVVLKKRLTEGKVAAEDSLEALYTAISRKTGKALGGAGADMSTTMSARLTHLGDLPERYFEKLSKSEGFAKMSDSLGALLEQLDPESPRGRRIFGGLHDDFDAAASIIASIDLAGIIETATDALAQFERGLLVVLSHLPGERGQKAGIELYNFDKRQDARRLEAAKEAEFSRRAQENGTSPAFERAASEAKAAHAEMAKAALDGYAGGLADTERVKVRSEGIGEAGLLALAGEIGAHSPATEFIKLGRYSAEGYAQGIEGGGRRVDRAIEEAMAPPTRAASTGGGARVITLAPSVTVQVTAGAGADANAIADMAAAKVSEQLPGMVWGAIDSLAQQAGAGP